MHEQQSVVNTYSIVFFRIGISEKYVFFLSLEKFLVILFSLYLSNKLTEEEEDQLNCRMRQEIVFDINFRL